MTKSWLTKSTYIRSLQCQKSLYLYKYYYNLRDKPDSKTLKLFRQGHNIEDHVRKLFFPGGVNVKPSSPRGWGKSILATEHLITNDQPIIYEAAFNYKGVFCAVDVALTNEKKLTLYEIKRGSKIKDVYKLDIALQYYVINSLGFDIDDFYLINYRGDNKDDLSKNKNDYVFTSLKDYCIKQHDFVSTNLKQAQQTVKQEEIPNIRMGLHCYKPYKCDYISFCERQH